MDPEAPDDAEHRLAERAEELDERIAAGERPSAIDPDAFSPAELTTLRSAHESLLRLERVWPRGGASLTAGESAPGDPGHGEPPAEFGRFRVVRELGRGGFGVVLLAIDPDLNRPVALKLPRAEWLLDARGRERFVREARAVAGLDHPHIAPLYEAGEVHGVCYMASAYCDGPDLARWLREQGGRIAPRTAARIVADLADAIRHAHERGVLHRDLKPSNVLLQRRPPEPDPRGPGRPPADEGPPDFGPRIVDFGLARLMDPGSGDLTASFAAVGSAPYMAPEQAEGKKVGPAADIYGLGALLYAMLCGRPPHRGRSEPDTLRRVVADEVVPPRRRRRDLPRDLEAICMKCLEKDPGRRYADAGALPDGLRRLLAGAPTLARSRGRWDRARRALRRHRLAAAGLALLAVAGVALLTGVARYEARLRETRELAGRREEEARRDVEAARRARYVADLRQAMPLIRAHHVGSAIELLGRHRPAPGEPDLRGFAWRYLRGRCDTSRRALAGFAAAVYSVEFSPAGDLLAAAGKDGSVRIWKTGSWELLHALHADQGEVNFATFSPDGATLATVGDAGTFKLWDVATGRCRLERPAHRGDAVIARFTPDGKSLLTGGREDGLLKLWDLDRGTESRSVGAHAAEFECAVVSPDGKALATTGGGAIKLWDLARLSLVADGPRAFDRPQGAAFSRDGKAVAVANEGSKRVSLLEPPSLRARHELAGHTAGVFAVAFAADDRILFSAGDDHTIRCWDAATGTVLGIHHGHTGRIWGLATSPDGRTLASASDDGTVRLWDPARPREPQVITIEEPLTALRFSRDGKRLATLGRDGRLSIRETDTGRLVHSRDLGRTTGTAPRPPVIGTISADLGTTLLADADNAMTAWDAERGRLLSARGDRGVPIVALWITADGRHAASFHLGGGVDFWDVRAARRLGALAGRYGLAAFVPDGPRLLLHDIDRELPLLWDPTHGSAMRPPSRIRFLPSALALSSGGDQLAFSNWRSDGTDYPVRVIDMDRLISLPNLAHSPVSLLSLAFDPTGRTLAGGGTDHRIRLWDLAGGEELLALEGHSGPVSMVHFSDDGETLATGAVRPDGATEVCFWRTGRP